VLHGSRRIGLVWPIKFDLAQDASKVHQPRKCLWPHCRGFEFESISSQKRWPPAPAALAARHTGGLAVSFKVANVGAGVSGSVCAQTVGCPIYGDHLISEILRPEPSLRQESVRQYWSRGGDPVIAIIVTNLVSSFLVL
jgi:hypothetical protein